MSAVDRLSQEFNYRKAFRLTSVVATPIVGSDNLDAIHGYPTRPRKPDSSLEQDAENLYAALSELVRVYQFRDRDTICCYDVSVTQCYAIEALLRRGPSGLNDARRRAVPRQEHDEPRRRDA